ncbi:MAG: bifunctional methylenetetrahydrofolate dehydrogenase/methenyltetrahydrofolate cyclohydrolase FolD [Clostridiales bacterium]|nr:bifunctional methylenetetrahydrofolate dehydrogenase/methenyltetrahydrofolate cyclohydrolase FolD [Clostridiales bacterium]
MYKLIDGKKIAAEIRIDLKRKVEEFKNKFNREIGLAVVLVGNNSASQVYVRNKIKACEEVGIKSYAYYLPEEIDEKSLSQLILELVDNSDIHGILVQLPLPKHINAENILSLIPASKDVDGFSAENIGKLCMNEDCLVACTPNGVMKMLEYENIQTKGKKAVVVGRSNIVGKPMALLLLNSDATVTVCHSKTENLKEECKKADILVAAIGKAKFITEDMVKEGAVVIDVGMNRDENGKLCGDVDFEKVKDKCSYITPVPGGVGPMTITMLMYNAYMAADKT